MKKYMNKLNHLARIKTLADRVVNNRLFSAHKMCILHGAGEKSVNYDFYFFNTFGKDFGGPFDETRLQGLKPDFPIDMRYLSKLEPAALIDVQPKCPQARFLMNNSVIMEVTLKLIFLNIQTQTVAHQAAPSSHNEKTEAIDTLKFLMRNFLQMPRVDEIERECARITPLNAPLIEILLNSAAYFNKKY